MEPGSATCHFLPLEMKVAEFEGSSKRKWRESDNTQPKQLTLEAINAKQQAAAVRREVRADMPDMLRACRPRPLLQGPTPCGSTSAFCSRDSSPSEVRWQCAMRPRTPQATLGRSCPLLEQGASTVVPLPTFDLMQMLRRPSRQEEGGFRAAAHNPTGAATASARRLRLEVSPRHFNGLVEALWKL